MIAPDRRIQNSKLKIQNLIRDECLRKKWQKLEKPYSSWVLACCQFQVSGELIVDISIVNFHLSRVNQSFEIAAIAKISEVLNPQSPVEFAPLIEYQANDDYQIQQTTNNQQQTTNNKQPTTNNKQQTTNNQQTTTNNQQPTTN